MTPQISTSINLISKLLIGISILLFSLLIINYFRKKYIKIRYSILKNKVSLLSKITKTVKKNNIIKSVLEKIAVRIGMLNGYDNDKNIELSTLLLLCTIIVFIIILIIIILIIKTIWYLFLMYLIIAVLFINLIFFIIFKTARMKFTDKLPETFKLLNSRYLSSGKIINAIEISLNDFDKSVKKEMIKLYDVLRVNKKEKIDETFEMIEHMYKNEHLTLLLQLIKQAHYKGGSDTVIELFEDSTEEILTEIENHKDLLSAGRIYIFVAMCLPIFLEGAKIFNKNSLGVEVLSEFYHSIEGIRLYIALLIFVMFFIGTLLFVERTGS